MRLYDITREMLTAPVYPGDPGPSLTVLSDLRDGGSYQLSQFSAGCHNGTHMDAPLHVLPNGDSIGDLPVQSLAGPCSVVEMEGTVTGEDIRALLPRCHPMVLFRTGGRAVLEPGAAAALARGGVKLFGMDAMSLAEEQDEWMVHHHLLAAGIPILEGLDLSRVPEGSYTLFALPLKLQGAEAAPVRAVLVDGR